MQEFKFIIDEENKGLRLDKFLVNKIGKNFSRSFIQNIIKNSFVVVNEQKVKPHQLTKLNDNINVKIPPPKKISISSEPIALAIAYEDEDILVLDKPVALVVHPAVGNPSGTLVNALLSHTKNLSSLDPNRPGIVHRLDKDTSGLLVVAKNNQSHKHLAKQFQRHSVRRKYIALVKGRVEFDEGIIDLPLAKDERDFRKIKVGFRKGKKAQTQYKVIKRAEKYSFLEIYPETGRTHQIRVHLAFIGHPILGDTKYGKKEKFDRLFLHAMSLGFYHPRTDKFLEFSTPIPEEFKKIIK